jgi:ABC-type Mn2+/Zn2+ transport system permease subunit
MLDQLLQQWLLGPLSYTFMQRATLAAVLIGIVAGVIGCFIVIRGMAFLTDALSHAVLPGVAVAYMIGGLSGPLALGAFIMGAISAVIIGVLTRNGKVKEDTAIGFVFTTMLALGIAIISARRAPQDLNHILVGNILAVTANDLALIGVCGVVVVVLVLGFYKELVLNNFDPGLARSLRLPSEALRYMLLLMLTLTIVISLQVIGVTLISAMLVTPAAAANLLTRRLPWMMLVSALIGAAGSVVGVLAAWHLSIAPSATIVITLSSAFLLAFLFAPGRGVWRRHPAPAAMADVE